MVVTSLMIVAAVAVLAGIAVVSTGHGGELAPADPHRHGVELPSGRTLTPADLESIRFTPGLWGYPPDQVEEVLDQVARSLAERDAHIADLEHRLLARQLGGHTATGGTESGEEESW